MLEKLLKKNLKKIIVEIYGQNNVSLTIFSWVQFAS